jgi:heptosyltransferase I
MEPSPPQPQSICLLRLSALGDVCNCLALVRALQRAWPETRITWIIGKAGAALLPSLANVEFIVFDKKSGWGGVRDLRQKLASRRFDVLLQAQVSARANLLSLVVKADRRIGFDRSRSREGHGLVIRERIASIPFQHQALAFLEFARHLGIETRAIDRRPPIPESALAFARKHQPVAGQAVLLSPASSHPGRNWHAQGYALISDWIVGETGRPVILIGGPSALERQLGQDIEGAASQPLINLIGQDTLLQALAMLDQAACLVAPDSGPVHFAAALGTPVVGLYAATWSKRSGPLGSLEHCVDRFPEAARKFLDKEPEQVRWGRRLEFPGVMDLITPEMVIERLKPLLDA